MIAAPLLELISTDFFEASAAHCDEPASQHDENRDAISFNRERRYVCCERGRQKRKRRRGVSRGGVP
jgi:hypothetical protein